MWNDGKLSKERKKGHGRKEERRWKEGRQDIERKYIEGRTEGKM
jgi:hypothetical protein